MNKLKETVEKDKLQTIFDYLNSDCCIAIQIGVINEALKTPSELTHKKKIIMNNLFPYSTKPETRKNQSQVKSYC